VTPDENGAISEPYVGTLDTVRVSDTDARGYAFGSEGVDGALSFGEGIFAVAGLLPGTEAVTAVPTSGTATYLATVNLVEVTDFELDSEANRITGIATPYSGSISLTADFDAGDRTLRTNGPGSEFTVNGRIDSSGRLSGDVAFNGIGGDLAGVIDAETTIGVFHGETPDLIYAGGFIGVVPP